MISYLLNTSRTVILFLWLFPGWFTVTTTGQVTHYSFSDSWGAQGFTLYKETDTGVLILFSINQFSVEPGLVNGEVMQTVQMPGAMLQNNEGAPNLPGLGKYIALPQGALARITRIETRSDTLRGLNISPAPKLPLVTDPPPLHFEKDPAIYGRDLFYPVEPVVVSAPRKVRSVDAVVLGITPFQYNPTSATLVVIRDILVEISFEGGNGYFGEDRYRNPWWDEILRDLLLNNGFLNSSTPKRNLLNMKELEGFEYLIITPDDPGFITWADSLRRWRNAQGILTGVVALSEIGGNSSAAIESYINQAYTTWAIPPSAVLLLGDYGASGDDCILSPVWDGYCVSDNLYADVDGDDLPDVVMARIPAQDGNELALMIGRMMDYEEMPPDDPDYYDHPVSSGGWQEDRWFILCTDVLWGFWKYGLGKEPLREFAGYNGSNPPSSWSTNPNTGMVVDYFGPNGWGYIPQVPSHLTDWGGNAARITADLNEGAFMIVHRDHGVEDGWESPSYQSSDLSFLNGNPPTYVFSLNCLTGKFNLSGNCFSEAFLRLPSGALGVTSASDVSYSFVNDVYTWGLWDHMWPDFDPGYGTTADESHCIRPAFANASAKYYLEASNWPNNPQYKPHTYYLFHHFGDAYLNVFSEVPQMLSVTHNTTVDPGSEFFSITADTGALIGISVNGEYLASAIATGSNQQITIPPQAHGTLINLVITKQNHYRNTGSAEVVGPPTSAVEPFPADGSGEVFPFTGFTWNEGPLGTTDYYRIYLGTDHPPSNLINGQAVTDTSFFPGIDLDFETAYFWRVDSYNEYGAREGSVWTFATCTAPDEDFETGDFSAFDWYFGGDADWLTDNTISRHGNFSARAGTIEPGESATLAIENYSESFFLVPLSFWVKTSTVPLSNTLQFIIDGEPAGEWSGETDWTEAVFSFMPGLHILEWTFSKTVAGPEEDSAWIDYIGFPPGSIPVMVNAGNDTAVCAGSQILLNGHALNYFSLLWSTTGDGLFDNNTVLDPVYTPGPEDQSAQSVNLILTAFRNDISESDSIILTIHPLPGQPGIPEGPVYVDLFYTPTTTYATAGASYSTLYTWLLQPGEAGEATGSDTLCLVTWAPEFQGIATLGVTGFNPCGEGPCSETLDIQVCNTVGADSPSFQDPEVRIIPNPTTGTFTVEITTARKSVFNLQLITPHGQLIYREKNLFIEGIFRRTLTLCHPEPGIYFLQLNGKDTAITKKLLITP